MRNTTARARCSPAGLDRRDRNFLLCFFFLTASIVILLLSGEVLAKEGMSDIDGTVRLVTLKELVKHAAGNNPGLKAARAEWARVIQRYPQATALKDPMLMYAYPIEEIETRLGPQESVIKLIQKIPFPGKLGLKGDMVAKDVEIARARYEKEIRNIIVAVKKSFYELYYIDKALALTEQNKKVLEHFTKVGTADYAVDATALNDVLKAQSQYAQASYDLLLLKEMRAVETTRLNTLLNRSPEERIEGLEEPELKEFDHSLDDLYKWASANEEIKIADIKIEKSELAVKLSRYKYLPDFQVGLNYVEIGERTDMPNVKDSGRDGVVVTFGINVPIWLSKNKASVREARFKKEGFIEKRNALKNETDNRVKKVFFKLTNSRRLVELYGESLIPQAQQSIGIAETWYKEGQGSLSGLLETQVILFNFQLAYYRAAADYLKNIANLEMLTGRVLY